MTKLRAKDIVPGTLLRLEDEIHEHLYRIHRTVGDHTVDIDFLGEACKPCGRTKNETLHVTPEWLCKYARPESTSRPKRKPTGYERVQCDDCERMISMTKAVMTGTDAAIPIPRESMDGAAMGEEKGSLDKRETDDYMTTPTPGETALEPCPFCGGSPESGSTGTESWIQCSHCEVHPTAECISWDEAVALWNRRATPAPDLAAVQKVIAELEALEAKATKGPSKA